MDILLLLLTNWQITKKNAKHPQDDNYHKISLAYCSWSQQSAEDGITHRKHQWLKHFVRHFRTMWADDKPLLERSLSTGAELAGTARILSNKYPRGTNAIWLQMSASFVSLSNDTQLTVSIYWVRIFSIRLPRPRTNITVFKLSVLIVKTRFKTQCKGHAYKTADITLLCHKVMSFCTRVQKGHRTLWHSKVISAVL